MWIPLLGFLFILWCIGKFSEAYYKGQGGRKQVTIKHSCYTLPGSQHCPICGKKQK